VILSLYSKFNDNRIYNNKNFYDILNLINDNVK